MVHCHRCVFLFTLVEGVNHEDVFEMSGGEAGFGLSFQMMAQQSAAHRQSMMLMQSSETSLQLQQALDQISTISAALSDIQRHYQEQVCCDDREKNGHPLWSTYVFLRVPGFFHTCVQVKQGQSAMEESSLLSELQNLKEQLDRSEEERKALETQLSEANSTSTQLQEKGSC